MPPNRQNVVDQLKQPISIKLLTKESVVSSAPSAKTADHGDAARELEESERVFQMFSADKICANLVAHSAKGKRQHQTSTATVDDNYWHEPAPTDESCAKLQRPAPAVPVNTPVVDTHVMSACEKQAVIDKILADERARLLLDANHITANLQKVAASQTTSSSLLPAHDDYWAF